MCSVQHHQKGLSSKALNAGRICLWGPALASPCSSLHIPPVFLDSEVLSSSCHVQLALVVCLLRTDGSQSRDLVQPVASLCILADQRKDAFDVCAARG